MSHSHSIRCAVRLFVPCVALLLASSTVAAGQPTAFVCGDADGNGSVTVTDGVHVLARAADLDGNCTSADACDVDGDGRITVTDGVAVLRRAAHLSGASECVSPVVGDESVARTDVALSGCESVTAETGYCLTFAQGQAPDATTLAVLGLDSGRLCDLAAVPPELGFDDAAGSIGWRGEILYVCAQGSVLRVSLRDGRTERLPVSCQAVAANDGAIFLMPSFADASPEHLPGEVFVYASLDDLRAAHATTSYQLQTISRLTATDDRLYGAWHSTHTIERIDVATGAHLDPVALEGYDDWVNGFSVVDDGSVVVNKFVGGSGVTVFDADTGARTGTVSPARSLNGLACVARF